MTPFEKPEFKEALRAAFVEAINKVGLSSFKQISWFASNSMATRQSEDKKAA